MELLGDASGDLPCRVSPFPSANGLELLELELELGLLEDASGDLPFGISPFPAANGLELELLELELELELLELEAK